MLDKSTENAARVRVSRIRHALKELLYLTSITNQICCGLKLMSPEQFDHCDDEYDCR